MSYKKSVELFMADGTPDGLMTAKMANWDGKAIRIPRGDVSGCDRTDIQGVGVYLLFSDESIYIGESQSVKKRLLQHLQDYKSGKEEFYWDTAIIFTSESLNKAHIRYLEHELYLLAKNCGRYALDTKATYSDTALSEAQEAAMEEFLDNIKIIVGMMGYRVFVPMKKATETTKIFTCGEATGFVSDHGFTVQKGSKTSEETAPSFPKHNRSYYELRLRLETDGIIIKHEFTSDHEFPSFSAAASVIRGRSANGNLEWKAPNGTPLRDNIE